MIKIATALRQALREGYNSKTFIQDLQAGATVGIVAIPLAMALAIASGVPPQLGLYTVVIGGAIVALLGGSRYQVTGPTAAFVVLLVPVVHKFGLHGLLTAGLISGCILVAIGYGGFGKIIQVVPHPVTTGFTSGIAVVIAVIQLKDFLGLKFESPETFVDRVILLVTNLKTIQPYEAATGFLTLGIIIFCAKRLKKVPAPIAAVTVMTILVFIVKKIFPDVEIATIQSHFSYEVNGQTVQGIPAGAPKFLWPWQGIYWAALVDILPSACAIAILAAIESLLSAVVADGMTQERHDPDAELIGLGIGNIIGPFFGCIPATGAIARTTTNIHFGARTPMASFLHAMVVLAVLLFFAKVISLVPLASLAALLLFVAYNMFDRRHLVNILRMGSRDDRIVLLTCFILTVIFDMVVGVGVGVVMASLLMVKRFAATTQGVQLSEIKHGQIQRSLPKEMFYYQINGPLFFGASQRAIETMEKVSTAAKVVVLELSNISLMDVTGLVALDSSLKSLVRRQQKSVVIICASPNIRASILKLEICRSSSDKIFIHAHEEEGFSQAFALIS